MSELFISMFPNAANYWDRFLESMEATFQMFFIAGLLTMVIGAIGCIFFNYIFVFRFSFRSFSYLSKNFIWFSRFISWYFFFISL